MSLCTGQAVPAGLLFSDCLALKLRALWPFEVLGTIHLEALRHCLNCRLF
jgi:hypothetical protein